MIHAERKTKPEHNSTSQEFFGLSKDDLLFLAVEHALKIDFVDSEGHDERRAYKAELEKTYLENWNNFCLNKPNIINAQKLLKRLRLDTKFYLDENVGRFALKEGHQAQS